MAFFTLAVAYIWGKYTSYMAVEHWIALALCAAVAGTMGDLFESQLKDLPVLKTQEIYYLAMAEH